MVQGTHIARHCAAMAAAEASSRDGKREVETCEVIQLLSYIFSSKSTPLGRIGNATGQWLRSCPL